VQKRAYWRLKPRSPFARQNKLGRGESITANNALDGGLTGLRTKEDLPDNRNGTRTHLDRFLGQWLVGGAELQKGQLTSDRKKRRALRLMSMRVSQRQMIGCRRRGRF